MHRSDPSADGARVGLSRRAFLRGVGAASWLAAAAGVLPGHGTAVFPGRADAASATGDPGTLLVGTDLHNIRTLDPGRTIEVTGMMMEKVTYDTLVTFSGEDLRPPRPVLATSWKVSADGRAYTFALRPGVRFVSGNPMTSADVKWTFDRILNLKANTSFLFDGVADVQAPDPGTVVIHTKASQPSLIPILSHPGLGILDSKLLAQNGGDAGPDAKTADRAEAYMNVHSAGTGSFVQTSYIPAQELVLERNPQYWRGPAKLSRIVVRHVPDPVTQALQLVRGDLDVATSIGQDQIAPLRRAPNVAVKTSPAATTFYILMNNAPDVGGPFANPKVQQAVRYALDYQGIMAIAGPGAVRLAGVIPSLMPGLLDPKNAPTTDREKAKALLRESGIGEVRGKFSYASDQVSWGIETALLAQKIQSDLSAVGIQLALDGLPIVTAIQQYRGGKNQFGVWGWAADYPDAADFLVYAPGRVVGMRAGWPATASPAAQKLAALADAAEAEVDTRKRVGMLQDFERTLAQIGPYVPLFQPAVPYAYGATTTGVTYHSVWAIDYYPVRKTG